MTDATTADRSALSPSHYREYNSNGFLVLRKVFLPEEIEAVAAEADRLLTLTELIQTDNLRCRWQPNCDTGDCLFETFDPVIDLSPRLAEMARDPRLLSAIGGLYGEPAHLFKDKLIFKPPAAKGYDLHQDYIAWPNFPRSFVTAVVAIDRADRENGCTIVYPGRHKHGCLTPEDGDYHSLPDDAVDESTAVPLELEPGDVGIFGCFTPHRSAPNRSDRWRRLLYLSYNADADGGDQRARHYDEFHAWLRVKYAQYGKHNVYFE